MYRSTYFYWVPDSMKINTHKFYRERYPNISPQMYEQNENALVVLVHNTKSDREIMHITACRSGSTVKLFRELFKNRTNRSNLAKFFALPVI